MKTKTEDLYSLVNKSKKKRLLSWRQAFVNLHYLAVSFGARLKIGRASCRERVLMSV